MVCFAEVGVLLDAELHGILKWGGGGGVTDFFAKNKKFPIIIKYRDDASENSNFKSIQAQIKAIRLIWV